MLTSPRHLVARRRVLAIAAGAVALLVAVPLSAEAAPVPASLAGDPHSPTVAFLAASALAARDEYVVTGAAGPFHTYRQRLNATADAMAGEFATDPVVVRQALTAADLPHQTAVLAALSQLGAEYRYATSDPAVGFDCSGLTAFAWSRAGVELPHQSSAQINVAPRVSRDVASAGDLVQYPGHVMMYLGFGDAIVHAANSASDVALSQTGGRSLNWADPIG